MKTGLVLLAHGSRDPAWSQGMEALAQALSTPEKPAVCAYVELSPPTLLSAATALHAQHCDTLEVVPMFLGLGQHARHDLPRLVAEAQQALPTMRIEMQPALCDRPQFIASLCTLLQSKEPQ